MKNIFVKLIIVLIINFNFYSCSPIHRITKEHVIRNQDLISELTKYMIANNYDTISIKNTNKIIRKKLKKIKIYRVIRRYSTFYSYPDEIKDSIIEFNRLGNIFGYNETILVLPKKSKDKYNKNVLGSNFEKVNDTIYIGTWPALPLM
ncbi:hypothetical protein OX283_011620 [Flavobacterium sp. SUN052]|uniref:hypothetical protein n=1 Tax=Flavobacterium sp. SUN052 TaxID=3002441 RepID=UPI00237E11CB|nr:hypothetical protein [Flavobacterium sp. SUN052]MEC4005306.1 hypothetical protein [Flavobacterium sp. SUN052]